MVIVYNSDKRDAFLSAYSNAAARVPFDAIGHTIDSDKIFFIHILCGSSCDSATVSAVVCCMGSHSKLPARQAINIHKETATLDATYKSVVSLSTSGHKSELS